MSESSNGGGRSQNSAPKEVVLLVHGIRTFAWWQPMVKRVLEEIPNIEVHTPEYGYFSVFRFWCPFLTRNKPIDEVRQELQKAKDSIRSDPDARLSVIAHSYGTYVITSLLLTELDLRLHRLVLCGSIVQRNYPWHTLGQRLGTKVVNDYGTKDICPVLAKCLSWGYGDTGRHKFGKLEVVDRAHDFAHSDYFLKKAGKGEDFVRQYWKPLFEEEFVPSTYDEDASSPAWLSLLSIFPVQWIVLIILLIFGISGASTIFGISGASTEVTEDKEVSATVLDSMDDLDFPPEDLPSMGLVGLKPITDNERRHPDFEETKITVHNQSDVSVLLAFSYIPRASDSYAHRKSSKIPPGETVVNAEVNFGGPVYVSAYVRERWIKMNWVDLGVVSNHELTIDNATGAFRCTLIHGE